MAPTAWMTALKEFNDHHNKGKGWCIPRKGTKEHNDILEISRAYSGEGPVPEKEGYSAKKIAAKMSKKLTKIIPDVIESTPVSKPKKKSIAPLLPQKSGAERWGDLINIANIHASKERNKGLINAAKHSALHARILGKKVTL